MPEAHFLVPEASFSDNHAALAPYSSTHRDVLIPGHIGKRNILALLKANRPMTQRAWLAAYRGNPQGKPWREQVRHAQHLTYCRMYKPIVWLDLGAT